MAGADSIEIVLFHQTHIFADMFQRNSRTYIRITVMTVGSAETNFLTIQVYNGIFDADFTETDALANRFTIGGKSQCIQIRMFCIPQGEIGSRKCNAVSFRNTFCNNAAAGSGQFVRNRNGFFCKRQRNCYVCSSIIVF